jgi:membrane associated rhomboid family serine protease
MLRRTAGEHIASTLWSLAVEGAGEGQRHCPACEHPMRVVSLPAPESAWQLDVCTRCYFVWFDRKEFESLAAAPSAAVKEQGLPLEARLMLAKVDVEALDPRPEYRLPESAPPAEAWKAIPAFFGLPVEQESRALAHLPWGTFLLAPAVMLASLLAYADLRSVIEDFGLIPADMGRYWGLTLLTPFFLHGSLPHLAGNLYYLIAFGDDVEDYLGTGRFLLVLLLSTLAGNVAHAVANGNSTIPLIGASGGISGLLACYGLQFPRARIALMIRIPYLYTMRWIQMRAWVYVLFWVALQAVGALRQGEGVTQVSFFAHLGGAAVGFLYWFFWPENRPAPGGDTPASA